LEKFRGRGEKEGYARWEQEKSVILLSLLFKFLDLSVSLERPTLGKGLYGG